MGTRPGLFPRPAFSREERSPPFWPHGGVLAGHAPDGQWAPLAGNPRASFDQRSKPESLKNRVRLDLFFVDKFSSHSPRHLVEVAKAWHGNPAEFYSGARQRTPNSRSNEATDAACAMAVVIQPSAIASRLCPELCPQLGRYWRPDVREIGQRLCRPRAGEAEANRHVRARRRRRPRVHPACAAQHPCASVGVRTFPICRELSRWASGPVSNDSA